MRGSVHVLIVVGLVKMQSMSAKLSVVFWLGAFVLYEMIKG